MLTANLLLAQDDELPPPTSKPNTEAQPENTPPSITTKPDEDFKGFTKPKKVDLSKFVIEPNPVFSLSQHRIDLGLSPYVGYQVFSPKHAKDDGVGLYAGGGITYFYTGFRNIGFTDQTGKVYYANAKYHTYGGGVFLQYNIWRGFFVRTRFEVLHRVMDDFDGGNVSVSVNSQNNTYTVHIPKIQRTIPALLIGAGYNLLRSKNFFLPIVVSYNVLGSVTNKTYSIYPNGWVIQLGFINVF